MGTEGGVKMKGNEKCSCNIPTRNGSGNRFKEIEVCVIIWGMVLDSLKIMMLGNCFVLCTGR